MRLSLCDGLGIPFASWDIRPQKEMLSANWATIFDRKKKFQQCLRAPSRKISGMVEASRH